MRCGFWRARVMCIRVCACARVRVCVRVCAPFAPAARPRPIPYASVKRENKMARRNKTLFSIDTPEGGMAYYGDVATCLK